jgi:hypothetical protein
MSWSRVCSSSRRSPLRLAAPRATRGVARRTVGRSYAPPLAESRGAVREFGVAHGADGVVRTRHAGRVGITVAAGGSTLVTSGYDWKSWNRVTWHERRKAGWQVLRAAFAGR